MIERFKNPAMVVNSCNPSIQEAEAEYFRLEI
jgi:hypothetical protein